MKRLRTRVAQRDLGAVERRLADAFPSRRASDSAMRPFAILLVIAACISVFAVVKLHRTAPALSPAAASTPTHAVIIMIDGAEPGDLVAAGLPNLSRLARQGVVYNSAWVGQLQPDPASSAATIGTGVFPREHGILGPTWTDPQTGQPTTALSPGQVQVGSLDQLLESRNTPTLAGALKQQNANQRILSVGGVGCAAAAAVATWLADYVLCPARDGNSWGPAAVAGHTIHDPSLQGLSWVQSVATGHGLGPQIDGWQSGAEDRWIGRYAVAAMHVTLPTVTIVDFPEIGRLAPYVSVDRRPAVVGALMRGIDSAIGVIIGELRRERVLSRTAFVVTGGTVTSPFTDTVSRSTLNAAVSAAGGQEVYVTTDGAAMVGLQDPTEAQPLAQTLQKSGLASIDAIYFKARGGAGWTYQLQYLNPGLPAGFGDASRYLVGTMAADDSPEVVVIFAPGVGTQSSTSGFSRQESSLGAQWDTQHIPLILSGAGIFQGGSSDFPARLVDIAPTVEALFGLHGNSIDGTALADALLSATSGAADSQNAERQHIGPLVDALKKRYAAGPG